jgi:signal peptidase II
MLSRYLYFLVCFIFFVFTDLYFTNVLLEEAAKGYDFSNSVFMLKYVQNTGAAFNILHNSREILIILASAALTLIFMYIARHARSLSFKESFFTALLSAGIAGNLHERIQLGFVRDFFKLNFIDFPVFNISDVFITVGTAALIILILIKKTK